MKTSQVASLIRSKLLPGYTRLRNNLYLCTTTDELLGITIEGSSTPGEIYIWAYWMPLYAPTENLYFNLGGRMRSKKNSERWGENAMLNKGIPRELQKMILRWERMIGDHSVRFNQVQEQARGFHNINANRSLVYVLAQHGNLYGAEEVFRMLEAMEWTRSWEKDFLEEIRSLVSLFPHKDKLREKLLQNIEFSQNNLQLIADH